MPEKSKLPKFKSFQFNSKSKPFFQRVSVITAFVITCNLFAGIGFFVSQASKAQVLGVVSGKDGYKLRYSKTTNGALTFAGNSLCLSDAQPQGTCGTFITTDESSSDAPYKAGTTSDWTKNSSTGLLRIPTGSEILYAELIWGGSYKYKDLDLTDKLDTPVNLVTPKGSYKISPDAATSAQVSESSAYVRTANVTDIIGTDGSGMYTAGNIPATMDRTNPYNNYAGWTLAIAYRDLKQPPRNLSIFVGSEQAGPDQLSNVAEVKGFATPTNGNISGRLLVSAQEGDPCYSGDQMRFGQTQTGLTALSGPNNQKGNFFAAKINDDNGKIDTSGSFGTSNQPTSSCNNAKRQGWDIANVDISSLLKTNQTSAYAQGYSTGDVYMINALGMQIDVNAAKPEIVLKVDKDEAKIGDVLTYTMKVTNTGTANSDNTTLKGLIPAQTSFVTDSLSVAGKTVPGSDASTNVGTLKPGESIEVTYQVKVTDAPTTGKFVNTADLDYEYTMVQGDQPIKDSTKSNEVITNYNLKPNLPPVAKDDQSQTEQAKMVTIDVLNNDSDQDGNLEPNSLSITKNPANGNAMITDGKINYTPKDDFTGIDTFEYQICDSKQLCDTAKVSVTVSPKPDQIVAPSAIDDSTSTSLNTPVSIEILKNDTFSGQNPSSVKLSTLTSPTSGQVSYDLDGKANYIPNSGFSGQDVFEYKLCDKTLECATAKVTVTIKPADVPVDNKPTEPTTTTAVTTVEALPNTAKTQVNKPVIVPVLENDKTNSTLDKTSLKIKTSPTNGVATTNPDGTLSYTPKNDYSGKDSLVYEICNTEKICSQSTVDVSIDAGTVIALPVILKPVAADDAAQTTPGNPVLISVLKNDSAPDDVLDPATLKITQNPSVGNVIVDQKAGSLNYIPNPNFKDGDSFKYQICNSKGACSTATVSITSKTIKPAPSTAQTTTGGTTVTLPSTDKPAAAVTTSTSTKTPESSSLDLAAPAQTQTNPTQIDAEPAPKPAKNVAGIADKQSEIAPLKKPGQVLGVSEMGQQLVRTGGEFGINIILPLNLGLIAIIFALNKYTQNQEIRKNSTGIN